MRCPNYNKLLSGKFGTKDVPAISNVFAGRKSKFNQFN